MYLSPLALFLLCWSLCRESRAPVSSEVLQQRRELAAAHTAWKARCRHERKQARPHVYGLSQVVARLAWRDGFCTYWRFTHAMARCGSDWKARLTVLRSYLEHLKASAPGTALGHSSVAGPRPLSH